jgi:hypothetical protein
MSPYTVTQPGRNVRRHFSTPQEAAQYIVDLEQQGIATAIPVQAELADPINAAVWLERQKRHVVD